MDNIDQGVQQMCKQLFPGKTNYDKLIIAKTYFNLKQNIKMVKVKLCYDSGNIHILLDNTETVMPNNRVINVILAG